MSQSKTLKKAIHALINGDSDLAREAINSVISNKSRQIVAEMDCKKTAKKSAKKAEQEETCDVEAGYEEDNEKIATKNKMKKSKK